MVAGIVGLDNPYFSAGFGLMGVGAALALLQRGAVSSWSILRRRMLITMEIPNRDPSYPWFLQWAARHTAQTCAPDNSHQRSSLSLLSRLAVSNQLSVETSFSRRENGSTVSSFALVPAPGRHFLRYKRAWFQVERSREKSMLDLKSGTPWETVLVTALARDRHLLLEMLEEAKREALSSEEGKTVIYVSYGPEWRPFGAPRRRRALDSVVLDKGISEFLVRDVESFLANGKWYHDRGIPYRRGYLLYGPPGSGKTSFIQALAGHMDYNICVMNLSERGMTDDRLAHLLTNVPPRSLILLEDIDAAFAKRDANSKEGFHSLVTFSGLLNALDGVASSEERLVFMTTNHLDRLDPALIRPGRVDVKLLLDDASDAQARRMFLRFYPGRSDLADKFVELIRPPGEHKRCSPAMLQGHFVLHRDSAEAAVQSAASLQSSL